PSVTEQTARNATATDEKRMEILPENSGQVARWDTGIERRQRLYQASTSKSSRNSSTVDEAAGQGITRKIRRQAQSGICGRLLPSRYPRAARAVWTQQSPERIRR